MSTEISKALLDDVLTLAVSTAQIALEKHEDGSLMSAAAHIAEMHSAMRAILAVGPERFDVNYDQSALISEQSFIEMISFIKDTFEDADSDVACLSEILRLQEIMNVTVTQTYSESVSRLRKSLQVLSQELEYLHV